MTILNPITHAGVLGTNANLEPEARLQGLLRLWFGRYFSDTAFTTRGAGGTTGTLTFAACDFLWQDDKMPVNPQRPVIHTLFTPLETQKQDLTAGMNGQADRWQLDVMIRVPGPGLTVAGMTGTGDQVTRHVASQMLWLMTSSERDALSIHGVHELRVERPPAIMPSTTWYCRMLTASCLTRREQAR